MFLNVIKLFVQLKKITKIFLMFGKGNSLKVLNKIFHIQKNVKGN